MDIRLKNFDTLIDAEICIIGDLKWGSEERAKEIENYNALIQTKMNYELESKEKEYERKRDKIRFILEAAGILVPVISYGIWFNKGLKFEEHGTVTSMFNRNLFGKAKMK